MTTVNKPYHRISNSDSRQSVGVANIQVAESAILARALAAWQHCAFMHIIGTLIIFYSLQDLLYYKNFNWTSNAHVLFSTQGQSILRASPLFHS